MAGVVVGTVHGCPVSAFLHPPLLATYSGSAACGLSIQWFSVTSFTGLGRGLGLSFAAAPVSSRRELPARKPRAPERSHSPPLSVCLKEGFASQHRLTGRWPLGWWALRLATSCPYRGLGIRGGRGRGRGGLILRLHFTTLEDRRGAARPGTPSTACTVGTTIRCL